MRKYIILAIIGFLAVITAWYILIGSEKGGESLLRKEKDSIIVAETVSGDEDEKVDIPRDEDVSENSFHIDPEESASINERLSSVDGLNLRQDTGYIFVGDSRFVNMNTVCKITDKDNLFVVAKVGEGYNWFNGTALSQIKRIVSSGLFSKWKILICLGINDLGNLKKYMEKYEELKDDYDISLISVNPVENYGSLSNEMVSAFNSAIKDLSFPYIDTYDILLSTGYKTVDGLHYDGDTTRKIYNGILLGIRDEDPEALSGSSEPLLDSTSLSKKKSIQSDISSQNKYVKKEADPDTQMDPEVLKKFLESVNESLPPDEQIEIPGDDEIADQKKNTGEEIPTEAASTEEMQNDTENQEEDPALKEERERQAAEEEKRIEEEKRQEEERRLEEEKREEEEKRKEEEKRLEEEEERRREEEKRLEEERRQEEERRKEEENE